MRAVDADEVALLSLVTEARDRHRLEIAARAEAQAREILRAARRDATERVRRAVHEDRERRRQALEAAKGDIATTRRFALQQGSRRALACALPALREALGARWNEPERRDRWIVSTVEHATRVMPPGRWRVEHPSTLAPGVLAAASERVRARTGQAPELAAVPDVECGLRIVAGSATLDASLEGLLRSAPALEGRLLAELDPGGAP